MSLHFDVHNQSAPHDLLFVHGNMASKNWWRPTLDLLQKKWQGKTLPGTTVVGEIRGHGRAPLNPNETLRLDDIVNDFIAMSESAKIKNALIVGHSAGGLITALLLARRPDLYKGGLMIDPVGPQGLTNVPADIDARYAPLINNRDLAAQIVGATIYQNNPDNEFFKTVIMDDSMMTLKNCGTRLVKALMNVDYRDEVATMQQPARIYYGDHDWVLPRDYAHAYADLIKKSEFVSLKDNGHCMNFENPEFLAEEIHNFLEAHFA